LKSLRGQKRSGQAGAAAKSLQLGLALHRWRKNVSPKNQ
jgi:hypothetical protein